MLRSAVVLAAVGLAAAGDGWVQDRTGEGVTVFTKEVPGYGLKAFKAVTRVNVGVDAVAALIGDAGSFPKWYADCSENRILKKLGPTEYLSYFVNDSPFPVTDRDSIMHTVVAQDAQTRAVTFTMVGKPKEAPENPDRVRVPRVEGRWTLLPISAEETEVTLEMKSDPGGSVPAFLANQQVTVGPHKTLLNLRKMVQKPRYKNAKVDYATVEVTYGQ